MNGLSEAEEKDDQTLYLYSDRIESGDAKNEILSALGNHLCLCVQDVGDNRTDMDTYQKRLDEYLSKLFSKPSRWEEI